MSNWGLKISRNDKSVDSTEPLDYVFHSKYGSVKIITQPPSRAAASISVPASSSATASIEHGQSFPPLVLLFTELNPGSGRYYCGSLAIPSPTDSVGITMDGEATPGTYVDSTYVKIRYLNSTGVDKTVKYYYFILGDDAS